MSPKHATKDESGVSKSALLPSAETKCAGEKDASIESESDDLTVTTVLSMDSELDTCNLHSVDLENNMDLHIDLEDENIMTKDFLSQRLIQNIKTQMGERILIMAHK